MKKEISVGGQAVIEGVMMRGPDRLATAIRRRNGEIELKISRFVSITQRVKFYALPIVRGFVSLLEMMKIGFSTLTFSAERYELDLKEEAREKGEQIKEKSKAAAKREEVFSFVLAFGLAFLLFGLLPYKLSDWMQLSKQDFFFNLFAGSIRIVFFVVYIWAISLMKDVKRLFRYHGAEHKNVNAYEHNSNLQISDIQGYTTIHPRCGTSFMFFVLLVGILVFSITDTLVSQYILKASIPVYLRLTYHLLLIPIISGLSYEVLKFSGRNLNHPLVKFMTVPGMALQRITTQPPDDDMVETALVAMKAALDLDYSSHKVTLLEALSMIPIEKLECLKAEFLDLQGKVSDASLMSDARSYKALMRRYKELDSITGCYAEYQALQSQSAEARQLLETESDAEMQVMIKEEIQALEHSLEDIELRLRDLLIPSDPNDEKNAIIEIRAGTGGEEAALFVADLYRMYNYYADQKGWKKQVIDSNETGLGGFKEIVMQINGDNAYGLMRFESGVHRVQRVPVTESGGRIHTSAVTVAVLPEAEDIDIDVSDNDLRIDVYRSSGNGGQSVNTTDSAVRITHIPTGLVVTCQDEKSQFKNKAKAMKVLRSKLLDLEISRQEQEIASSRRAQVSTGDRSAKIRTYNFPQSRVTDHRISLTSYNLDGFLAGNIDEFIQSLRIAWRNEKVNA